MLDKNRQRDGVFVWNIEKEIVDSNVKGIEFYTRKNIEMAKKADLGFMIWNGKSKGTFNNLINLTNLINAFK